MTTTQRGLQLVRKLGPAVGYTAQMNSICSLICRYIAIWDRLGDQLRESLPESRNPGLSAETAGLFPDAANARITYQRLRLERRLETLVTSLPGTRCGPWRLDLPGDAGGSGVLLPPDGCKCLDTDDRNGRGVLIP
jgi:hypothetical protein